MRSFPEKRTRTPVELGFRPSPTSMIPALTSSSLNFPISVIFWRIGITPDSDSLQALTSTMTLMFCPFTCAHDGSPLVLGKQICRALTPNGNGLGRNRHPERNISKNWAMVKSLIRAAKTAFPVPVGQTQVLDTRRAGVIL